MFTSVLLQTTYINITDTIVVVHMSCKLFNVV